MTRSDLPLVTLLLALSALSPAVHAAGGRDDREFADAKRRADLQLSAQQRECDKLEVDTKDACLARVKAHHDESVEAARLLYLGGDEQANNPAMTAAFEEEMARCSKMSGKERGSCSLDVKLRYRQ